MKLGLNLLRYGGVPERDSDFQSTLIGCNGQSLDSFLAFLAAFFSFGFKAGFFLSSLLLLCSLLIVVFQMFVEGITCRYLGDPKIAESIDNQTSAYALAVQRTTYRRKMPYAHIPKNH
jgi:hypothetical protein